MPIIRRDRVSSLIILTLNLKVEPSIYDRAYALEPKLRANLMNELLILSNNGAFSQNMTNPDNLKAIKKALFRVTRDLLGDEVKDILILELTRQDQ